MDQFDVRLALSDDWETIVDFNCRLAEETENMQLDPATVRAGVEAVLADPHKGRYFVACVGQNVVGQMMHTWEWSDWRNGEIWWLQSVFVAPQYRRQGVFRRLYQHLLDEAVADPNVVGLRLYVERENQPAHATYRGLGMQETDYLVMERFVSTRKATE